MILGRFSLCAIANKKPPKGEEIAYLALACRFLWASLSIMSARRSKRAFSNSFWVISDTFVSFVTTIIPDLGGDRLSGNTEISEKIFSKSSVFSRMAQGLRSGIMVVDKGKEPSESGRWPKGTELSPTSPTTNTKGSTEMANLSDLARIVDCAYEIYAEDFQYSAKVERLTTAAVYGMGSAELSPEFNMAIAWTVLSDYLEIPVEEFLERAMGWYNDPEI